MVVDFVVHLGDFIYESADGAYTAAVTSVNAADALDFPDGWDSQAFGAAAKEDNEHLRCVDWYVHGYAVVEFTDDACTYIVYDVNKDRSSADARKRTVARYRAPDGNIHLEEQYTQ